MTHRGKRSVEAKIRRKNRFKHLLTFYDDEQKEVISQENTNRLQLHQYRKNYQIRFIWLEEPVEAGEVLADKRGRGTLQIPTIIGF